MGSENGENWTEDRLLDGRLTFRQPKAGYRAGADAALLAAAVTAKAGERVIEAGCGAGGALLAAASRNQEVAFVGIEREAEAAELAMANIDANGFAGRAKILVADIEQPFSRLNLKVFDHAIANPPFFDDPLAIRGPAPARRGAWIADAGLGAWTGFLSKAVREGGTITLIHRADRLGEILALLEPKVGSFRIRPVHPFADTPAKRVLVRGVKTGRAPLVLLPPLVMHDRGGAKHTDEAEAILRGEAALAWD